MYHAALSVGFGIRILSSDSKKTMSSCNQISVLYLVDNIEGKTSHCIAPNLPVLHIFLMQPKSIGLIATVLNVRLGKTGILENSLDPKTNQATQEATVLY